MKKMEVQNFSNLLIQADINFIRYIISRRNIKVIQGVGIDKLLTDCEAYIALPEESPIYNTTLKPILVLYTLTDTIRRLWLKRIDFTTQLSSMNTGTYTYGEIDPKGGRNFKDFELELFITSYLNEKGIDASLPQATNNNDIFYKDIEIQCKHPEVFKKDQVKRWLDKFQDSLVVNDKHGIFCVALDDQLGYKDDTFPYDHEQFERAYLTALQRSDNALYEVFNETMPYCSRVLGVITVNTHFMFNSKIGLVLGKTTNSVFSLRTNSKAIPEECHIQAYEVLSVFNERPSIVHF